MVAAAARSPRPFQIASPRAAAPFASPISSPATKVPSGRATDMGTEGAATFKEGPLPWQHFNIAAPYTSHVGGLTGRATNGGSKRGSNITALLWQCFNVGCVQAGTSFLPVRCTGLYQPTFTPVGHPPPLIT
ncbi:hypothetical protein UY3_09651 [Chelonia mydas]|uniref:Uncharacterized protein n=1 Tax=Chelonia mydas TaxID=8469 RepID=M7BYP0_CHEMY|nr:hypothetical protein UY3_09651 [Chelonia mydas]